ncbi:MAG: ATP-binding cassette domain-containing protein [Clostridia bacterium]|nr:ATP-binding cassette domain-containing protein [Clostridia bacterium]
MITVKHISKSFKIAKREAGLKNAIKSFFKRKYQVINSLEDINFSIKEGEIVGYIGPNGAGKSTTIKIMAGILVPTSGECIVNGYVPWKDRKKYVKNIGVVFGQRSGLWWDVPPIDSFELLKDIYEIPQAEYEKKLSELKEYLNLDDILNIPTRQLSLGQRMRCEIASALLHNPKVLFLDEPTIGLDAVSKLALRKCIKQINEKTKITIILTTHDMQDIEALTKRIILIGKGKILYDGSLKRIKNKYNGNKKINIKFKYTNKKIKLQNADVIEQTEETASVVLKNKEELMANILNEITNQVELVDMNIEEMSTDDIIAKLYNELKI